MTPLIHLGWKHCLRGLAVVLVLLTGTVLRAGDAVPTDFRITGPGTWTVADASEVKSSVGRLADKDLKTILRMGSPAVVFLRYAPGDSIGVNPSVKVVISETPDPTPAELLTLSRMAQKRLFPDYTIREEIKETTLNDIPAATMAATFIQ